MAKSSPTQRKSSRRPNPRQRADTEQPPPFLHRRSTRLLGIGLAVALVGGAAGIWYLSRGAEVLTTDQAVEEFRSEGASKPAATATPAAAAAKPAEDTQVGATNAPQPNAAAQPAADTGYAPIVEGVYTFATDGYEETDALSGQRHDYPKETAMTIRNGGCGWISRWEPLRERWEETEACEQPDGTTLGRYTMYHEFFQRGVREDFTCPGSFIQKPSVKPGDTWPFNCKSDQSTVTGKVTVVRFEDVNVGGTTIRAARYRYDVKVSGANRGTMVQERWLTNSPRALVRMTQDATLVVSSPFGPVNYREEFRIDLKSLNPRT